MFYYVPLPVYGSIQTKCDPVSHAVITEFADPLNVFAAKKNHLNLTLRCQTYIIWSSLCATVFCKIHWKCLCANDSSSSEVYSIFVITFAVLIELKIHWHFSSDASVHGVYVKIKLMA